MRAVIAPGAARGTVAAPPSKSMAHRLLICAGLAEGESLITHVDPSEDILATLDCLRALGAEAVWEKDAVRLRGCDPARADSAVLPCRESGSTLRFMIPLALLSGREMQLQGSETLMTRPLGIYEDICRAQGLRFEWEGRALRVAGRLAPGRYCVPGNISSQFISGLLFALPLLAEDSRIELCPPVESRPYLDMTLEALRAFGVGADWSGEETLRVPGGSRYRAREAAVEGDYSNAAFFEALNCAGGGVTVTGLRQDSLQGDRVYREAFDRLRTGMATVDVTDCPDLAPVLFTVAALCHGGIFTGTRRLRFKESDRGTVMAGELAKFGITLRQEENRITVCPGEPRTPREPLDSHNDHRIAMALSVLCTRTGGEINGAEAVRKSLPDYWRRLKELGVEVQTDGMDQP